MTEEWVHPATHGVGPRYSGGWVQLGEWSVQGSDMTEGLDLCYRDHEGHGVCLAGAGHEHPHFCCNRSSGLYVSAVKRQRRVSY